MGDTLTPEMLQSATEDHVISLEAQFAVNSYPVTIRYHINSNDEALGGSTSTRDNVQIAYGTQIDEPGWPITIISVRTPCWAATTPSPWAPTALSSTW